MFNTQNTFLSEKNARRGRTKGHKIGIFGENISAESEREQ